MADISLKKKSPGLLKLNTLQETNNKVHVDQKLIDGEVELLTNRVSSRSLSPISISKISTLNQEDYEEVGFADDMVTTIKNSGNVINKKTAYRPIINQMMPENTNKKDKNSRVSQLPLRTLLSNEANINQPIDTHEQMENLFGNISYGYF